MIITISKIKNSRKKTVKTKKINKHKQTNKNKQQQKQHKQRKAKGKIQQTNNK